MARDVAVIRRYAVVTDAEAAALSQRRRADRGAGGAATGETPPCPASPPV